MYWVLEVVDDHWVPSVHSYYATRVEAEVVMKEMIQQGVEASKLYIYRLA